MLSGRARTQQIEKEVIQEFGCLDVYFTLVAATHSESLSEQEVASPPRLPI